MFYNKSFLQIVMYLLLFTHFIYAKDNMCSTEYSKHKEIVAQYSIRMEDSIEQEGCAVIPLYSSIIEAEKFELLDKIEDDSKLMQNLLKLFSKHSTFSDLLFQNQTINSILLDNGLNNIFLENVSYLLKNRVNKHEIEKIKNNNNYLNYMIFASNYSKNKRDSLMLYDNIVSTIPIALMPSFSLVLSSVGNEYDFFVLLENFTTLAKELSTPLVKALAQYPQYFAYFLYPSKESLGLKVVSRNGLEEIQQRIQKESIYIYKKMFDKYQYSKGVDETDYALLTLEYIYPYLLQEHTLNYNDFTRLFDRLIAKGYLFALFQNEKCSNTTQNNFAVFGEGNIRSGMKLLKKEKHFSNTLFSELKNPFSSIMSFFYVANVYEDLNVEEWKIFKNLLKTLPYKYDNKIVFLQRIEKSGYFRNIIRKSDYKQYVNAEYGDSNQKYKYILLTPYPSQRDETLLSTVLHTNISDEKLQQSLNDLIVKNLDELETHEFTKNEKFFGNLDTASNIATVAAIGLAPFTGGTSLSYVAVVASKEASKKGAKYMMRKIALQSRKTLNKAIRKVRVVRKKIDGQVGIQNRNVMGNISNNIDNKLSAVVLVGTLSLLLDRESLEIKQICQE